MNKNLLMGLAALIVTVIVIGGVLLASNSNSDTVTATPTPKIQTVGILVPAQGADALLKAPLAKLGFVEGENVQYVIGMVPSTSDYETAIQSLIDAKVDVIVSTGSPPAVAASQLTKDIPIVFMSNQGQFLTDLEPLINQENAKTNLTGVITTNPAQRRFELMLEAIPDVQVVYVPFDPTNLLSIETLDLYQKTATAYNITIKTFEFTDDAGGQRALDEIPDDVDAILLGSEAPAIGRVAQWTDLSIARKVPLIVTLSQFTGGGFPPGILMGYGSGVEELFQQVADLVSLILQGTAPADLPARPSDIYLTVSIGAAKALGIELPDSILDQATQIIREEVPLPATAAADEVASGACNATLTSPLGDNTVCLTKGCSQVQDSGFVTYSNKEDVPSCSTENVLGICSVPPTDTYFYSGDVAPIAAGCASNGGEWKNTAE